MAASIPAQILVVDDDKGLLRLVERTLKRENFSVATLTSGEEAIAWLAINRADLMLLDLKLPDFEGKDLINHLTDRGCCPPFIIITGQGDERVAVDMMKRGALDYLVKDVRFIDFVPTMVRRALEKLETGRRLAAAQAALEESKTQLLMVSEREQRRFGAELHDGLGQQLTAIELSCQLLKQDLPPDRPDLTEQISRICQYLREAVNQTRSLAHGLSPLTLDSLGLAEALQQLATRTNKPGRVKCVLEMPPLVILKDIHIAGHLFRIAQEAVNNALKHSEASEITIRFKQNGGLCLEITDNGKGLPASPGPDRGIGLQIMKHRASVIGGELTVLSKPDKGVTISCIVPQKKDERTQASC